MTIEEVGIGFGILVSVLTILFALAKIGAYVLRSFHNEHIKPSIANVSHELQQNTTATANLTAALAKTDETQRLGQAETRATFDRMGQIIEDHEQRITALEPDAKPAAIRPRRRAS